ncbi:hypothetical protein HQ531_02550 [bacterium]|nr:hypothetical protein [bacterium]
MNQSSQPTYKLDNNGDFVIENYNAGKPFSSFFPGIAGKMGIPMWVFYVNRGQCICSMGVQDKDNPIMEFLPANLAYQMVSSQGFRTFLKFPQGSEIDFYEPFQEHYRDRKILRTQRMHISPSQLTLVEDNETLGLRFKVEYFSVPEDRYAGLIRNLSITNLNSTDINFEGLDGLPLIIPHGIDNGGLKFVRRLMEAFVQVTNYDESAPLFKTKVKPADRPDVEMLDRGNFYVGFENNGNETKVLRPIVDPQCIFGSRNDYSHPARFLATNLSDMFEGQAFENRMPSAMSLFSANCSPGATYTVTSIIGHAESRDDLNLLLPKISKPEYLQSKAMDSIQIIDDLTQKNLVVSDDPIFDMYVRQNFLDNVLRGGYPHTFKGEEHQSVLHLYSRKHGDLERDYNHYRITPSYYSQGNGNFRDINQNRRSDLLFNPDVGSGNLEHFINLIQLDGFNPLVIKEIRYKLNDIPAASRLIKNHFGSEVVDSILSFMKAPHTPGELFASLQAQAYPIHKNTDAFLGDFLALCQKIHDTDFAEGYWSDHWTYNLDLLENYLSVYPEKIRDILIDQQTFTYHDSAHRVLPRSEKYVIWEEKTMQLDGVHFDKQKAALIEGRNSDNDLLRVQYGSGEVYQTTMLAKFVCLLTNKIASLDPSGIGVEMESDKPNWYDALNGLPGIMGSSLSEALEVKRHAEFLLALLQDLDTSTLEVMIFKELHVFMTTVMGLIDANVDGYSYWDAATNAKESYRQETILGISGLEIPINGQTLELFLKACVGKIDAGLKLAWDEKHEIPKTYFSHAVTKYELITLDDGSGQQTVQTNHRGFPRFKALAFKLVQLPHFLEGPVHFLRCLPEFELARDVVHNIRQSELYDKKLGMYKVNAPLTDQPMEIGRARVFSPGWFENESIWLHMEYKYMLEMLRNKLYEDFFYDFKRVFIPFMPPETYGRSILENSSFLVSSANPDPALHGTGFVARLSGATAEFIHILMEMVLGSRPFFTNQAGELQFRLQPAIPAWLFTEQERLLSLTRDASIQKISLPSNSFSFMFLGEILVTYHNPTRQDTFGENSVTPVEWKLTDLDGNIQKTTAATLDTDSANRIRDRKIKWIEIELGSNTKLN